MTKYNNNDLNKISAFSQISYSTKSFDTFSIKQTLNAIKTGYLSTSKGLFTLGIKIKEARIAGKGSAAYNHIKTKQIPCVTWTSNFSSNRKKNGDFNFSGAIYFDVDEFKEGQTLEQAKADIITIPCVKAVWKSLSGKGLGGIIYSNGYELGYFHKLAELLSDKEYIIDVSVKDLESRLNVLSFDPNILQKDDSEVIVLNETSEPKKKISLLNTYKKPQSKNISLSKILLNNGSEAHRKAYAYASKELRYIEGQRNAFVTKYAGMTNQFGLPFSDMSDEIIKIHPDFDLKKAEDIYNRYSNQFGTLSLNDNNSNDNNDNKNSSNELVIKDSQRLIDIINKHYSGNH